MEEISSVLDIGVHVTFSTEVSLRSDVILLISLI
jgi:hypothetical protein